MNPSRLIARRYLKSRHSYGFISVIGYLGMTGLAIGVAALILTLSVMKGFLAEVEAKVAGLDGHMRLMAVPGSSDPLPDSLLAALRAHPDIASVTPYVSGYALIRHGPLGDGVFLLGAPWGNLRQALRIDDYLTAGQPPEGASAGELVLGEKLARGLGVVPGDQIHLFDFGHLVGEQGIRGRRFVVAALYRSGMVEYDNLVAFTSLEDAQALFGLPAPPREAIVNLHDAGQADRLAARLEAAPGFAYLLSTWRERHANLFGWLKGQQFPIQVIFGFIAVVAILNIFSTLTLVVVEKRRDIGILRSLGFTRKQVRRIFIYQGGAIGIAGSLAGVSLALLMGYLQDKYQFLALESDIYFMDALPVQWSWEALVLIPLAAVALATLSAVWPARSAARIRPSEALRYE